MEYNLDAVAPPQKPNPFKRLWNFVTSPQYSRTLGILTLLLIAAAIPLTAYFAQQQTRSKQQAAGNPNGKVEFVDKSGNPITTTSDPIVYLKITIPDGWQLPATGQLQTPNQNMSVIQQTYAQAACPDPGQPGIKTTCGYSTYDTCQDDRGNREGDPNFCKNGATKFTCWWSQNATCTATQGGVFPYLCSSCSTPPTPTPTSTPQPSGPKPACEQIAVDNYQFDQIPKEPSFQGKGPPEFFLNTNNTSSISIIKVWVRRPVGGIETAADDNNWTQIGEISPPDRFVKWTNTQDFDLGSHAVAMDIYDKSGTRVDYWKTNSKCGGTITLISGSTSQPTSTPVPTQPPGTGPKILARVDAENVDTDGSSGGDLGLTEEERNLVMNRLRQGEGTTKFSWKLNPLKPDQNFATRTVNVGWTATDGTNVTTSARIRLERPGTPGSTGVCRDLKPSETSPPGTDDPTKYIWKVAGGASCNAQPSCYNGENPATYHDKCPKNESQPGFVNPDTSRWCYGFQGPNGESGNPSSFRCLKLEYTGSPSAPTPTSTPVSPGQPTPTPTRGAPGAPTPTATPVPTTTPIPTPTPSFTAPSPGPASVTFSVTLSGIGQRGATGTPQARNNPDPARTRRDATLYLYALGDDPTGDSTGERAKYVVPQLQALVYDGNNKFVAASFNLGIAFVPGQYQVLIKTPRYLRKRIPGVQTINAGANAISQQATLTLGDANNDNKLDTLDYQEYRGCLNQQTTTCMVKADFNDNGKLDNDDKHGSPDFSDHALFTEKFAIIDGD